MIDVKALKVGDKIKAHASLCFDEGEVCEVKQRPNGSLYVDCGDVGGHSLHGEDAADFYN